MKSQEDNFFDREPEKPELRNQEPKSQSQETEPRAKEPESEPRARTKSQRAKSPSFKSKGIKWCLNPLFCVEQQELGQELVKKRLIP